MGAHPLQQGPGEEGEAVPGAAPLPGVEGRVAGEVLEGVAAQLVPPAASPEACQEVGMAVLAVVLVAVGGLLRKGSLRVLRW